MPLQCRSVDPLGPTVARAGLRVACETDDNLERRTDAAVACPSARVGLRRTCMLRFETVRCLEALQTAVPIGNKPAAIPRIVKELIRHSWLVD